MNSRQTVPTSSGRIESPGAQHNEGAERAALRLLHIDTARDWRGGQAQVADLVRGLAGRGHRVTLVTPHGSRLAQRLADTQVEIVHDMPRGEWDWFAGRRLRRLARDRRPDLVHAHSALAHAVAWLAHDGRRSPPIVVSRRVDFPVSINWFSRRKYLYPACCYLAISTAVRDALIRGGVPGDRISLVPSGVDPGKFTYQTDRRQTRQSLGLTDADFLVCNIGALTDHKDHATLIRAAEIALAAQPRLCFIVLGEGELRGQLESQIARAGIGERFRLLGFRDDVEPYLAAADLFVLSSHMEGLCTSLLDAMLLRVPIVATRAGGVVDIVVDGETGLLVEPRQGQALADAIIAMMHNSDLRERLAAAAARRVRQEFSIERTVELTQAAYREIIARNRCAKNEP
ncbi:glycosyltransferase [Candidatus Sumerlaeota bacterium]|nr:glycosyltransferase [Candidatus Sumerlaeota bacterium]